MYPVLVVPCMKTEELSGRGREAPYADQNLFKAAWLRFAWSLAFNKNVLELKGKLKKMVLLGDSGLYMASFT